MQILRTITPVALLLAASTLGAQDVTSTITGTVKDKAGKPIAGATLVLKGSSLLGERTARSGADGKYRFPLLAGGVYSISVNAPNFLGSRVELRISGGQIFNQDVTLKSMAETEKTQIAVVDVVAVSAVQDKTATQTATSFSQETLTTLTGANAYGVLQLAPGVSGTNQNVVIRGGATQGAQYIVNGMAARDNVTAQGRLGDYTLDDMIESTAVIQSPLNAKNGNSSSGLVTLVTKRGANDFSGSVRFKVSRPSWGSLVSGNADNAGAYPSISRRATDSMNRTYEITLSGPIIKDRLTFAYGTRLTPTRLLSAQTQQLTPNKYTSVPFGGAARPANTFDEGQMQFASSSEAFNQYALFYQISENHQLEYNYTQVNSTSADLQFNYVGPEINLKGIQKTFRQFYNLAYRGMFGANQLLEVRYGMNRSNINFPSGPGIPITMRIGYDTATNLISYFNNSTTILTGGATSDTAADKRATESLTANYNLQLNGHSIDLGIERQNPIWGSTSRGNRAPIMITVPGQISPNYGDPAMAGKYVVFNRAATAADLGGTGAVPGGLIASMAMRYGLEDADIKNPNDALYANDFWTINNHWSVMAGVRYDRTRVIDPEGTKIDSKTFSPRFEAKYDVSGDGSRVFNLSYAHFRGNLNARYYRSFLVTRKVQESTALWSAGTNTPYLVDYATLTNPANYTFTSFTNNQAFKLDSGFRPDVSKEVTLGYRKVLKGGGDFRMTLVQRDWDDLMFSKPGTEAITVYNLANPAQTAKDYTRTLMNDPEGDRAYRGFEAELALPLGARWVMMANYTWGRTVGNSTVGDGGADTNLYYANAGDFRDVYRAKGFTTDQFMPTGQIASSQEHLLKVGLTYTVTKGKWLSDLGFIFNYASGQHYSLVNHYTGSDLGAAMVSGLGTNPYTPAWLALYQSGRGVYTGPDTYNLNLTWTVKVPLYKKVMLETQLRCTNFLNHLFWDAARGKQFYTVNFNPAAENTGSAAYTQHSQNVSKLADIYNGYRMNGANAPIFGTDNYPTGARNWTLDVILRF